MLTQIKIYFLLFIIYSVMGWLMEVINQIMKEKKFVNRGFLIGPYCPIYGCGAILITLLLNRFLNNPVLLFIMAILVCGVLEYLTSFIMEKVFNFRWWDYSNEYLNINGRICIRTIIPFGILGLIIIYITNPFFINTMSLLSNKMLSIVSYSVMLIFIIDFVVSMIAIIAIKKTTLIVSKKNREDNTEQITQKVKEILLGEQKSFAQKRLFDAYPKLRLMRIKVKKQINKTREGINQKIDDTKEFIDDTIDKTKEEINKRIKKRK